MPGPSHGPAAHPNPEHCRNRPKPPRTPTPEPPSTATPPQVCNTTKKQTDSNPPANHQAPPKSREPKPGHGRQALRTSQQLNNTAHPEAKGDKGRRLRNGPARQTTAPPDERGPAPNGDPRQRAEKETARNQKFRHLTSRRHPRFDRPDSRTPIGGDVSRNAEGQRDGGRASQEEPRDRAAQGNW